MPRHLSARIDSFPLKRAFNISRGAKTAADVVTCTLTENGVTGRGECVPYKRYGETVEGVLKAIEALAGAVSAGMTRQELQSAIKPGAARNAVDCAMWDLEAKLTGKRVSASACRILPRPVPTAVTISLGEPADMADEARAHSSQKLLKVKVGTSDDRARMHAVASAARDAEIILDANEGWDESNIREHLLLAAELPYRADRAALARGQGRASGPYPAPGTDLRR
jgi:L-alanine-DL-glutamate epimerase-like enolase superfamily enzyme